MDAALKTAALGLLQTIVVIAGVGFGGWACFCLTRQQIQKAIFYFVAAVFLLSLWDVVETAKGTFSFSGVSLSDALEIQNSPAASTLSAVGFSFSVIGYAFLIKSIFMFTHIPDGQRRPSECFTVLGASIILTNLGSILQILLNTVSTK